MREMRGGKRAVITTAILAFAMASSGRASAGDCDSRILSTCINADSFWPHAGPSRFAAVGGTETTPSGRASFGLVTSYLSRPIVVHLPSPGPSGSDRDVVDNQVNGTFLFAYGVTNRLELDLALPVTFAQNGSGASAITGGADLSTTATRDLRFGATFAIVPRTRRAVWAPRVGPREGNDWSLAARFEISGPTGDRQQFASDRGTVFLPSLAADVRAGRFFGGAEAGLRIRPVTEFAGARMGSQASFALGAGIDVVGPDLLSITAEVRALPVLVEQATVSRDGGQLTSIPNGKLIAPAEWALGVRTAPLAAGDFAIQATGGGWLPLSSEAPVTTPRFRFSLSLVFAPRGYDSDGDGIFDAQDQCPAQAGPKVSEGGVGCPERPLVPEILDITRDASPPPPSEPPKTP